MIKRLQQNVRRSLLQVLTCSLLAGGLVGCANVAERQKEVVQGEDIAAVISADADTETTGDDLVYHLMAGEFAGVRGYLDIAVEHYSQAAQATRDPGVISRAAYVSLYAGDNRRAADLAELWDKQGYGLSHAIDRIRILAYLRLRDLDKTVDAIDRLLMVDGELDRASVSSLNHILGKEATPAFALEVAQGLSHRYPDSPLLMLLLSRFEASLGRYDEALGHVDQLISKQPDMVDAYLVKAQILAGQGKTDESLQAVAMVVKKRPQDTRLRLQYARMLVQFRKFEEAIEHFGKLRQLMPDDENVLLSLGLLNIEIGEYMKAKRYLQELLDKGYHNQQAHYYLGRIQQNQGEDMPAIANYERVHAGEYWLDARVRSSILMARSGQVDKALARLEAISERGEHSEENRIKLFLARGEVLRDASRNREALELYNAALNHSPENTDLLYARALTAEKLDMLDVTESDLKMVIMHEPENASALNALGYTLADRTQRYEEAHAYILKAAKLLPDDPAILDSLGWVHYRMGEYEEAIKWLSKAFERLQDAEIAAHLGEVLWVSGQTRKAEIIWEKGRHLDGNQSVLRDTIQRFK